MRIPSRHSNLRLFAHTRRILLSILPLGAAVGLVMSLTILLLDAGVASLLRRLGSSHLRLAMPFLALTLCTLWLTWTRMGEVSLFEDLDLAKHSPFEAFPFWGSLAKVVGCAFTIGLGGSTGLEGPAKWLGAALAGSRPLLPIAGPYTVNLRELLAALPLGLACGLGASLFLSARDWMKSALAPLPLWARGLAGGLGLALLAAPGHFFFHDLAITQRGGLGLVVSLLRTLLVPVVFLAETTGQAGLVVPGILACALAVVVVRVHIPPSPSPLRH